MVSKRKGGKSADNPGSCQNQLYRGPPTPADGISNT